MCFTSAVNVDFSGMINRAEIDRFHPREILYSGPIPLYIYKRIRYLKIVMQSCAQNLCDGPVQVGPQLSGCR